LTLSLSFFLFLLFPPPPPPSFSSSPSSCRPLFPVVCLPTCLPPSPHTPHIHRLLVCWFVCFCSYFSCALLVGA
jgi:hypothetical protein